MIAAITLVPRKFSAISGRGTKHMANESQTMKPLSEATILDMARQIVDAQRKAGLAPTWGTKQHIGLLRRAIQALCAGKADDLTICKSLDVHGLGGNASQFRQWLNSDKGLGKTTFPPTNDLSEYA